MTEVEIGLIAIAMGFPIFGVWWLIENRNELSVEFIEEWSQWFTPCNWYDFHVFHCHFENDWKFGNFYFRFVILGIGFGVTWSYDADTEFRRKIMKQIEDLNDDRG